MNILPDEGAMLDRTSTNRLAYADDIVLLGYDMNTVRSLYTRLIEVAKKVNLCINEGKTEYMVVNKRREERQVEDTLKVGSYKFKKVAQLK